MGRKWEKVLFCVNICLFETTFVNDWFSREYEATVDSKGRFLLPAGFKKQLPEEGNQFVISRGFEKCLTLYPMKAWEPIFNELSKLNDFDPKVREFRRYF